MTLMASRKLSVTLDASVAAAVLREAEAEAEGLSLSAWINRTAERALKISEGLAAVAEWEAEHGMPTEEEIAAADAELDRILRPAPKQR